MTAPELKEIVEQQMDHPWTLGRLACNLRSNDLVEQRHHDERKLHVLWRNTGDFWRCTIFLDEVTDLCLVQVDLLWSKNSSSLPRKGSLPDRRLMPFPAHSTSADHPVVPCNAQFGCVATFEVAGW
jgi:hypothetical protein